MDEVRNWLSHNVELVVGSAIGLGAIAVAITIAVLQRKPKRLDYEVVNNVPVLSHHAGSVRKKLKMVYDDMVDIKDPRLVTIRIQNTGKVAIDRNDHVQPILIHYSKGQGPVDSFIARESARDLCREMFDDTDRDYAVALEPELMNDGDWFEVQLISEGDPGEITVESRFKGQSRSMRPIKYLTNTRKITLMVVAFIVGIAGGTVAQPVIPITVVLGGIAVTLALILLLILRHPHLVPRR